MKIVCISDTHGQHPELPRGDVLIHCGDLCHVGDFAEFKREVKWLQAQPHKHKIFVPGNHDICTENIANANMEKQLRKLLSPVIYLRDAAWEFEGVSFHGSPWIPNYAGAWNLDDKSREQRWNLLSSADVLITHGPPSLVSRYGDAVLSRVVKRLKPQLHIFGHVEEEYGVTQIDGTTFINAALSTRRHKQEERAAITIELGPCSETHSPTLV